MKFTIFSENKFGLVRTYSVECATEQEAEERSCQIAREDRSEVWMFREMDTKTNINK